MGIPAETDCPPVEYPDGFMLQGKGRTQSILLIGESYGFFFRCVGRFKQLHLILLKTTQVKTQLGLVERPVLPRTTKTPLQGHPVGTDLHLLFGVLCPLRNAKGLVGQRETESTQPRPLIHTPSQRPVVGPHGSPRDSTFRRCDVARLPPGHTCRKSVFLSTRSHARKTCTHTVHARCLKRGCPRPTLVPLIGNVGGHQIDDAAQGTGAVEETGGTTNHFNPD